MKGMKKRSLDQENDQEKKKVFILKIYLYQKIYFPLKKFLSFFDSTELNTSTKLG